MHGTIHGLRPTLMSAYQRCIRMTVQLLVILGTASTPLARAVDDWGHYESYFLCLFDYPIYSDTAGYREDVQGMTHDDDYWYITQSDTDDPDPAERSLWKIHVTCDLSTVEPNDPGVQRISLDAISALGGQGYNHLGDLTYHEHEDQGYLVIPVEGQHDDGWLVPVISVFTSDDLQYRGHEEIVWPSTEKSLGWCAVVPAGPDRGCLYASDKYFNCYKIPMNWDSLPGEVDIDSNAMVSVQFYDEDNAPLGLYHVQGGVFSDSGELLYVSSGMCESDHPEEDGVHVFDMTTHRRIAQSTNGFGHFNFEWYPAWPDLEEPEGLTIWDLDADPRAPGVFGQLHVLLLDNDVTPENDDEVSMKHYTQTIYLDGAYPGEPEYPESGRPTEPFNTVSEGVYHYPAWPGSRINITAGAYDEAVTFSTRMQVVAEAGTVTIGE